MAALAQSSRTGRCKEASTEDHGLLDDLDASLLVVLARAKAQRLDLRHGQSIQKGWSVRADLLQQKSHVNGAGQCELLDAAIKQLAHVEEYLQVSDETGAIILDGLNGSQLGSIRHHAEPTRQSITFAAFVLTIMHPGRLMHLSKACEVTISRFRFPIGSLYPKAWRFAVARRMSMKCVE